MLLSARCTPSRPSYSFGSLTGDLAGQYSVQMAENSFADSHFIFRRTDFDTEDRDKTFVRNFSNITHFDTVLTRRI